MRAFLFDDPGEWLALALAIAGLFALLSCALDCKNPRTQWQQVFDGERVTVRPITTCEEGIAKAQSD